MPVASTTGRTAAVRAVRPANIQPTQIAVLCSPSGTTHVVLDVNGYFR
jgi:hypothetical protein